MLEREKPHMAGFQYADFPGYAIIRVSDTGISADVHVGDCEKAWKAVPLSLVKEALKQ